MNLDEMAPIIRGKLARNWAGHADFDDAVQEATIHAWKDLEKGGYEPWHVINRAVVQGKKLLIDNRKSMTGAAPRTKTGVNNPQGEKTREKINQFIRDYVELHGKHPTNKVVSAAVGVTDRTVAYHRRRAYTNVGNDGGVTRHDYTEQSLTAMLDAVEGQEDRTALFALESFESDLIDTLDFTDLVASLNKDSAKALTMFNMGFIDREIGEAFGYMKHPQPMGNKIKRRALKEAKEVLEA